MTLSQRTSRALVLLTLVPLAAFVLLMAAAMSLYPGGTWDDAREIGHSMVRNYFCDLLRPVAINGQPNATGANLAQWSLIAFSVALLPFFLMAPACFPERRRLGALVRGAGALCFVGGVGIVLVPSWRFGALAHGVMVLLAAVPGLTAAFAATLGAWSARARHPGVAWAAVATLTLTAVSAGIFARQLALGTETTIGLALLQKVAVLCAIAWMGLTSRAVWSSR